MTTIPLVNYQKRKNTNLFSKFSSNERFNLTNCQNYIPIYNKFFSLNNNNYNSINLNHIWYISDIKQTNKDINDNDNIYNCKVKNVDDENQILNQTMFVKFAPLLDPFKYFVGKYNHTDPNLFNLPSIENTNNVHSKILDSNNSAYIDSFFSYLSSMLLNKYKFINGLDFYGSFLAIKNNYKINIADDLDYLIHSEFFIKNKNVLFQVPDYSHLFPYMDDDNSISNIKKPIVIHNNSNKSNLSVKSIDNAMFEDIFINLDDVKDMSLDLVDITNSNETNKSISNSTATKTLKSGSSCSSRTSHTNEEEVISDSESEFVDNNDNNNTDNDNDNDNNNNTDNDNNNNNTDNDNNNNTDNDNNNNNNTDNDNNNNINNDNNNNNNGNNNIDNNNNNNNNSDDDISINNSDYDKIESDEEEVIKATFEKFPVQVICLENCKSTLDSLILENELTNDEWFSILMQVIMTLITYQKTFSLTHNDLHTNNIMYVETGLKHIYYLYKKKYYKVPTFGKLFKIIDFGRAIYKYDGKVFCSDSFQARGDASGQYNTEPYFNDKKERLEPNPSFDLCRLACSIFDFLVDDISDVKDLTKCKPIVKLITEWCIDDNGVNVLYKNTGEERYPDFKLYKMIARCVHNHTPQAQLDRPEFANYIIDKKKVSKDALIVDIDALPSFC